MKMLTAAALEKLRKKHRKEGRTEVIQSLGDRLSFKLSTITGKCVWLFRFTDLEGRAAKLTLGEFPTTTQEEARKMVAQCRRWLVEGVEPRVMLRLDQNAAASARFTVQQACEYWLERCGRKSAEATRRSFERHIYPHLGAAAVDSLEVRHWLPVLDAVASGEHTGRPAPVHAGRVLADLKCALKLCRVRSLCTSRALDDLTVGVIGQHATARQRQLDDNELRDLMRWTLNREANTYYRRLVRLLLVFGCRSAELRLSHVKEWDLTRQLWTVPGEHTKSGDPIVRPIPAALIPFIRSVIDDRARDSGLLLGVVRSSSAVSQYVRQLHTRLGHAHWTAHDMRRTFSTRLNENGASWAVVESLVGHKIPGVERHYNLAQHLAAKQQALNEWYAQLQKLERHELTLMTVEAI